MSDDLRRLAEKVGPEEWEYNNGNRGNAEAQEDAKRLGGFVFKDHWGAIASVPRESPQFSRHDTLMAYIAAANPKAILARLDENDRLRERYEELMESRVEASLHPEDSNAMRIIREAAALLKPRLDQKARIAELEGLLREARGAVRWMAGDKKWKDRSAFVDLLDRIDAALKEPK